MRLHRLARFDLPWTTLREVGNLSAVKATVLIPLIGYLILFNQNVVEYLRLSPELTGAKALRHR